MSPILINTGTAGRKDFSTDAALTENSDALLPTQRAVKAYVLAHSGGGGGGGGGTVTGNAILNITDGSSIAFLRINADDTVDALSANDFITALGLGTIATQNASNVSITGGSMTNINTFTLLNSGSGARKLQIAHNGSLSSDRVLNLNLLDATRQVNIGGDLVVSSDATISGTNTGDQTTISGNSGSATKLATARNINGLTFDGTANISDYALDTGSTNTFVTTPSPAVSAYTTGVKYCFKSISSNTGACTINISGLGAKSIVKAAGGITTALVANDIISGQMCILMYDGTNMQIISALGNAASVDLHSPSAIGDVAQNSGAFTTIACFDSSGVSFPVAFGQALLSIRGQGSIGVWSNNLEMQYGANDRHEFTGYGKNAGTGITFRREPGGASNLGIIEICKVTSGGTPITNSVRIFGKAVAGVAQVYGMSEDGVETQLTGTRFPAVATLDFPSTAAGAVSDLTISVTGAAVGDVVSLGVDAASVPAGGSFSAFVSATDTVTVRYSNNSLVTAYDPASGTFKVIVFKS